MKTYTPRDFERLVRFVQNSVQAQGFPTGVIGVTDRRRVLALSAFGTYPDGRPIKTDSVYPLYSVSKLLMSTALVQLADQGFFHLEERVSRFLPDFVGQGKEAITLWHLLTHTSGLSQGRLAEFYTLPQPPSDIDLALEIRNAGLDHPVGTAKSYNPLMAFSVMGEVIRQVTGCSHPEALQAQLFEPLEMHQTGFDVHQFAPQRIVPVLTDAGFKPSPYTGSQLAGAGLYSTAEDLLQFARLILNQGRRGSQRLLSVAACQQMLQPQTRGLPYFQPGPNMAGVELGLGWVLPEQRRSILKRDIAGHNGAGDCMFWLHPAQGLGFVFMTNLDVAQEPPAANIEALQNVFSSCLEI